MKYSCPKCNEKTISVFEKLKASNFHVVHCSECKAGISKSEAAHIVDGIMAFALAPGLFLLALALENYIFMLILGVANCIYIEFCLHFRKCVLYQPNSKSYMLQAVALVFLIIAGAYVAFNK